MRLLPTAFLIAAISAPALAQHHSHQPPASASASYAEFKSRTIKALSAQQTADLQAGRGMGLALAAELNGYPGPMHVLEHQAALGLTAGQIARMEALLAAMRADAVTAGAAAVAGEQALDRLFASGTASEEMLRAAVGSVAQAHGEVRLIHLRTHIATRAALSPEQTALYAKLRGY